MLNMSSSRVPDLIAEIGALLFPLPEGSKAPYTGTGRHAHKEAVPASELKLKEKENYGIALDRTFLVVDFDRPDIDQWRAKLPVTLKVKSRRGEIAKGEFGEHWYYRVPKGYSGNNQKHKAGEVKCNGYMVGAGSVVDGKPYLIVDPRMPSEAPKWLLDYCTNRDNGTENSVSGGEDYSHIPDGARDNALASIAGSMRKHGLNEAAIKSHLWALVERGIVEQPEGREVTYFDVKRIARSISNKDPETQIGGLRLGQVISGADVDLVTPPIKWWVKGFVPKGELVMLYGKGGIGKSSFASWIANQVAGKGCKTLVVGVEEPFSRFLWRYYLGGGDKSLIYSLGHATGFLLPRDVPKLKEIIENTGIDMVYLDSVYTHFEVTKDQNAAERSRQCLSPLAELAQETGVTIVATFHENKAGSYLGSVEMVNVSRCVLRAKREKGKPLIISAEKTNLEDPGYALSFNGAKKDMVDMDTGEAQMEELEDGSLGVMQIVVNERGPNKMENAVGEIDEPGEINVDEIVEVRRRRKGLD